MKPKVKLYLPRDEFNSLVTVLTFFTETQAQTGETFFTKHSARLKNKIMTYAKASKYKDGENAVLNFFEDEAGVLLKLLTFYISFCHAENSRGDFFSKLKTSNKNS